MKKYFQSKITELFLCYFIVTMAMFLLFQYHTGNYMEIATNSEAYITYMAGLFLFYIYLSFQNNKALLGYLKKNNHDLYKDVAIGSTFSKTIHRYFPIFLMVTLYLPEVNIFKMNYPTWFYIIMIVQLILLGITIRFTKKIVRYEEKMEVRI